MKRSKWIVNSKYTTRKECEDFIREIGRDPNGYGLHDYSELEISVVRKDNKHGIKSYGWADEDKIVLFDDLGVDAVGLSWMEEVAATIAAALNARGL